MEKIEIKGLDLFTYFEVLENGLRVYLVPFKNKKGIYATLSTLYGGYHTTFNGKKYNDGIAHFLEHKMFEQEDSVDVMNFFNKNGAASNAFTSYFKTTYLFDGSSNFNENINFLLDYVQSPYFTKENIEKEKPIIEQEIDRKADNPYSRLQEVIYKNLFVNDPSKIPVIGTKESINKITEEELYECYNTFYHPSNMFLIVTGNIDPIQTMNVIKENQKNKEFIELKKELDTIIEPVSVNKKEETINMKITIPKISIGFKFDIYKIKEKLKLELPEIRRYINIFLHLKFGDVSNFLENVRSREIVSSEVEYYLYDPSNVGVIFIEAETKKEKEFIDYLNAEIKNLNIDKKLFEINKKAAIASLIYSSESVYKVNNKIMNDLVNRNDVEYDILNTLKNLNYDTFMKVINELDFTNYSIATVKSEEKDI